MSEKALLERAKASDPDALGEIYDRHAEGIYNYIYRRTGERELAEDLTSDVFVRMLRAIKENQAWHTSLSGWLYQIAHNRVIDHFRRQPEEEVLTLEERLVAAAEDPPETVQKDLARQRLRAAISHLTELQQQVIVLKFVEGLRNAEVAQILGKTEGAVKSLQYRGLRSLKRHMEEKELKDNGDREL